MPSFRSRPLAVTVFAACATYAVVLAAYGQPPALGRPSGWLWLAAGAAYTNLFEYGWHRWGMHGSRRDPRHQRHHRLFYGAAFTTRDPAKLAEITTSWYVFPVLLAAHAALFPLVFPARFAPAFLLGALAQYLLYESTHWWTHVDGNRFDRAVRRIPGLARVRAAQIRHHRLHHAEPLLNYNFTPPYAGDLAFRTAAPSEAQSQRASRDQGR